VPARVEEPHFSHARVRIKIATCGSVGDSLTLADKREHRSMVQTDEEFDEL
jgi:hypothetical protein